MRYLSKLKERLALNSSLLLGALLLAACADASGPTASPVISTSAAQARASSSDTIVISPDTLNIAVGEADSLSATVLNSRDRHLKHATVTWASSTPATASVSSTGEVSGISPGSATITASSDNASTRVGVHITALSVDKILISPSVDTLEVGAEQQLTATLYDAAGATLEDLSVVWTTSDATIATVDSVGLVVARDDGTALITATSEGKSDTATVIVNATPAPLLASVASVSLDSTLASIAVGSSVAFTATLFDSAGNVLVDRTVTWTSGSTSVATVDGGVATGIAAGSTSITATSEGQTASAALTVSEPTTPSGSTLFSSDWGTATGNSDNAITDGGTWNSVYCSSRSQTLSVVSGSSVGFTLTSNVLRLQQLGYSVCGMLEAQNALPLSTSHWGRMYFRNDEIGTQHNHVATYHPVGAIQLAVWNRGGLSNGVRIFMRTYYHTDGSSTSYPQNFWTITTPLAHGTWYRYEWHMEYVTPTSYRVWPRIYDMSGQLVRDATHFMENDASATSGRSLAAFYAAGGLFGFTDVALARNVGLGNEGPGGSTNTGGYWYHAKLAYSTGGWIGQ